jgi:hypothetical protein
MTATGAGAWTTTQVAMTYQRIHELQTPPQGPPIRQEPAKHLVVHANVVQQYDALLRDLREAGLQIAGWHDLAPDATGTVSEHELRDSLDVLTKLVEDETDTRMPTG